MSIILPLLGAIIGTKWEHVYARHLLGAYLYIIVIVKAYTLPTAQTNTRTTYFGFCEDNITNQRSLLHMVHDRCLSVRIPIIIAKKIPAVLTLG
jgi:hypothetical protein